MKNKDNYNFMYFWHTNTIKQLSEDHLIKFEIKMEKDVKDCTSYLNRLNEYEYAGFDDWRLPTIEEQQKIAIVLTNADKEIGILEQQLTNLKQEKKALMQQLLTGKCRVKVNDKDVI